MTNPKLYSSLAEVKAQYPNISSHSCFALEQGGVVCVAGDWIKLANAQVAQPFRSLLNSFEQHIGTSKEINLA